MTFMLGGSPADRTAVRARARLHIGCGTQAIPGWINVDNQNLSGVDRIIDVRNGLPFSRVEAIFAEHFLEHLTLDDGLNFLREARRVLDPAGLIRISTPNLDWVYLTHYRTGPSVGDEDALHDCLQLNRAFHGWGHQFLFNRPTLAILLRAGGFAEVRFCRYGESEVPYLRNLERHEKSGDTAELPHVIIAEAYGHGTTQFPEESLREYRAALVAR